MKPTHAQYGIAEKIAFAMHWTGKKRNKNSIT